MFANGGALQSVRVRSKPMMRALGLHMGGGVAAPPAFFKAAQAASLLQSIRVPSKAMALRFQLAGAAPPPPFFLFFSRASLLHSICVPSKPMLRALRLHIGGAAPPPPHPPTTPLVSCFV